MSRKARPIGPPPANLTRAAIRALRCHVVGYWGRPRAKPPGNAPPYGLEKAYLIVDSEGVIDGWSAEPPAKPCEELIARACVVGLYKHDLIGDYLCKGYEVGVVPVWHDGTELEHLCEAATVYLRRKAKTKTA